MNADKIRLAVEWDAKIRQIREQKSTRFGKYQNLSEVVSEATRLRQQFAEAWEDLDVMDGSGDCGPLVAKAQRKKWRAFIDSTGLTEDQLTTIIELRTSPRWVYFNFGTM
jgi:hypothetical protein